MASAIGMIEFKTVSAGITATDQMVKTASVKLLESETVCPGKYISLISGELSAVKSAVERAINTRPDEYIDSFVLGNPDESIFPAIYGSTHVEDARALGILETYDASAIIVAADTAAKTTANIARAKRTAKNFFMIFSSFRQKYVPHSTLLY